MKVWLPVIRNFSGADVMMEELIAGLPKQGVQTEGRFYPHLLEFLPYSLLRPFLSGPDCDIVHTKAEYGWLFAVPGKPLVVHLAHSVFDRSYQPYKSAVQKVYHRFKLKNSIARSLRMADRVVTVSKYSAQEITRFFGRRDIDVIYNGVDTDFFRPAESPEGPGARLFFAGNCTRRKGFDLLPQILDRLPGGFVLEHTAGLRGCKKQLQHSAMRALGTLSRGDLLAAYRRCDILLFPSRLEGFGLPLAEAMACSKPVVCTNCSSLPELIDEGRGGFLCPPDDVDCFADRVRRLAGDPALRRRMGSYNRAKAERRFSLVRFVGEYARLYDEAASAQARRRAAIR